MGVTKTVRFVGCARVVRKFPHEYELILDEYTSKALYYALVNKPVVVRVLVDGGGDDVVIRTVVGVEGGFKPPRLVVRARTRDYPVLGSYEHRTVPLIITTLDGQG